MGDFEDIEFRLDLGNLIFELALPCCNGMILGTKPYLVHSPCLVELVELIHVGSQLLLLLEEYLHKFFFCVDGGVGFAQVCSNLCGRKEEVLDLLMEHSLKVNHGNLVPAGVADIFWRVGRHIHLLPTAAVGDPGKEVDDLLGGSLPFGSLGIKVSITLIPEFFGHDGFYLVEYPLTLGLKFPRLLVVR